MSAQARSARADRAVPLPGHHNAEAPGRKLTLFSCCARVTWTLRVFRLVVVCVVATGVCGNDRLTESVRKWSRMCDSIGCTGSGQAATELVLPSLDFLSQHFELSQMKGVRNAVQFGSRYLQFVRTQALTHLTLRGEVAGGPRTYGR